MKLLQLSWKNIWRNPLRSGVVTAAVALGLFSGVFSVAFMNGMGQQSIDTVISRQTAHIQLHDSLFTTEPLPRYVIGNADSLAVAIGRYTVVSAVAARIKLTAMAATAKTAVGVTVLGVDREAEEKISKLPEDIVSGDFFKKNRRNSAVIGAKLAKKLGVKLRSKIVVTTQGVDGDLTGGAYRVIGIFKTNNSQFDESTMLVRKKDIAPMVGVSDGAAHELAVLLKSREVVDSTAAALSDKLHGVTVQRWNQIAPEIGMMESLMQQMLFIFVMVILIALSFGIVNTMLMAVLERKREFGMLMAVGMSRGRIFAMVLIETVLLSLSGGIVGMGAGALTVVLTAKTGINLSMVAEGLQAIGYSPMVYPYIDVLMFSGISCMVVITGILASLYPAFKAIGLNPADAVRSDT